jgi:hypothetical protein
VALQHLSGLVVLDRPPSPSAGAQPPSDAGTIQDDDARVDIVKEKVEEKVEEKKKEAVFFKGVELVDLDDCDIPDMRLQCDNDDTDDDDAPNPDDMDVDDGGASSSQRLELNIGPTVKLLQSSVRVHSDRPSEATPSVYDPLFNVAGKAPHPDAVVVKQEAGWFQLCEEKRQRKTAEKLALQHDVLLGGNLGVPITEPTLSAPAPSLQGVPCVAFPIAGGASGSQSSPFVAEESLFPLSMPENFNYP